MPKSLVKPEPFGGPVTFRVFIDVAMTEREDDASLGFRYSFFGDQTTTELLNPKVKLSKEPSEAEIEAEAEDEEGIDGGLDVVEASESRAVTPKTPEFVPCWDRLSAPTQTDTQDSSFDYDEEGVPGLFRWESRHTKVVDEEFIKNLNSDSLVSFFQFQSKPIPVPRSSNSSSTPSSSTAIDPASAVTMSYYENSTIIDVSPFLSGQNNISRRFGSHPVANAWNDQVILNEELETIEEKKTASLYKSSLMNLSPSSSMRLRRTSSQNIKFEMTDEQNDTQVIIDPETPKNNEKPSITNHVVGEEDDEDEEVVVGSDWLDKALFGLVGSCSYDPPPDITYLKVTIVIDKGLSLLPSTALFKYNPLTLTVASVRDLPGVRVEAASLQKYVKDSPFELQRKHCCKTYVIIQPITPEIGPRLLASDGVIADKDATFDFETSILTSFLDRHLLDECIEMKQISIEVHDRDPVIDKMDVSNYDMLVKGDITLREVLGDEAFEALEKSKLPQSDEVIDIDNDELNIESESIDNKDNEEEEEEEEEEESEEESAEDIAMKKLRENNKKTMSKKEYAEWSRVIVERLVEDEATASQKLTDFKVKPPKGKSAQIELENLENKAKKLQDQVIRAKEQYQEALDNVGINVFEVDKLYLKHVISRWLSAGDRYTHGVSKFRLNELRNQARPLAAAFLKTQQNFLLSSTMGGHVNDEVNDEKKSLFLKKNPLEARHHSIELKMRELVIPTMRRVMPKGGEDDWALHEEERLIRKPARYLEHETSCRMIAKLYRPIRTLAEDEGEFIGKTTLMPRPFCRSVFIFSYEDVNMLQAVNKAIDEVNTKALGDTIRGSLRSHQLDKTQIQGAENGLLNVVCGFQIIDEHCRIILIEGLSEALYFIANKIPRESANNKSCRILNNIQISFERRLYTAFNVDLKKIRLRDPLPVICEMPELYNRTKVSPECFESLHRLLAIRNSNRLSELASQSLFPLVNQLLQMESKYGESISMEDIDGRKGHARKTRGSGINSTKKQVSVIDQPPQPPQPHSSSLHQTEMMKESTTDRIAGATTTSSQVRRKAATDSKNPLFEKSLLEYSPPNYLAEQKIELDRSLTQFEKHKEQILLERASDPVPAKYVYSGQKLQYTELKKSEMRAKLGREKNIHYTFSQEYLGAAMSMVDESRLKQEEEAISKSKWKTSRGFIYPAPRKPIEFSQHPNKPSNSRIDSLKQPWVENEFHPQPVSRSAILKEDQPDFDTIPAQGQNLFGGLHLPKYERPYDNNNLGNEKRLPRGRMELVKNNEFYKSVHLSGSGLIAERKAQIEEEEKKWQSKVVVDSNDFKVGGFSVRDKPLQIARTDDILKGPPKSKGLKIVRNAKLPSGKKVPLHSAPISAFTGEPYSDPKDFTVNLRPDDFETFLAKDKTGKPSNFMTSIHRELLYPKTQTVQSHRPIPEMTQAEKTGLRWIRQSSA